MNENKIYISLDTETTGFDPVADQPIEISAVKFQGDKIIETFDTLLNPGIEIPSMVTFITGIKNEDLVGAPTFNEIKDKLREFLGDYPIIGHNISFDIEFLQKKGLPVENPMYDTLHLAGILLDKMPSLSLDTLTRTLKIQHENKHRALSDALACFELFKIFQEKISALPPALLKEIQQLIPKSDWAVGDIFIQAKSVTPSNNQNSISESKSELPELNQKYHPEDVSDIFDTKGPLSHFIKNYETRDSQQKMATEILKSFKNHHHALIEAGTGTGKTLAYLMASALWCQNNSAKVVISTYTNNLQDQILGKDYEIIQKLFPKLTIAPLKGRRKYLSVKRLYELKTKNYLHDYELMVIIKILIWLENGGTGDLEELNLQGKELLVLEDICCSETDCKHADEDNVNKCFLLKARQKAEKADIVVVNHALLLQDLVSTHELLPPFQNLILDEAHHLEKVATDTLTIELNLNSYTRIIERLHLTLVDIQSRAQNSLFSSNLSQDLSQLSIDNDSLKDKLRTIHELISSIVQTHSRPGSYEQQVMVTPSISSLPEWQNASETSKSITEFTQKVIKTLCHIIEKGKTMDPDSTWLNDLEPFENRLLSKIGKITDVFEKLNQNITWICINYDRNLMIKSAPLAVKDTLEEKLYSQKESIILTSATLTTNSSFKYLRSELGLGDQFTETMLPSHFSYPDQVKIIVVEDMPNPNSQEYQKATADALKIIIKKNGGRTLGLFTSKESLKNAFYSLAAPLKDEGFNILAQGLNGGRGKILAVFKDEPATSALLGTNSFWEGVDLIGDDLTCVVIVKLPFDPPDNPLVAARGRTVENFFDDYQIPRAILRLKQGFGRLIRSASDTGTIVLLDPRIVQKAYGRQFLSSLPGGIKIEYVSKDNLGTALTNSK